MFLGKESPIVPAPRLCPLLLCPHASGRTHQPPKLFLHPVLCLGIMDLPVQFAVGRKGARQQKKLVTVVFVWRKRGRATHASFGLIEPD